MQPGFGSDDGLLNSVFFFIPRTAKRETAFVALNAANHIVGPKAMLKTWQREV